MTARPATVTELDTKAKAAAEDVAGAVLPEGLAGLRQPFPASQVGHLPKAGVTLDYVGHGAVTDRLLAVDPEWNWEPLAFDEGLPRFTYDAQGNPIALWIKLTVLGVTRLGVGTCKGAQFDAEKVLIGDAIRNAAMRFGVALDLWIRGHAEDDEQHANDDDRRGPKRQTSPPEPTAAEKEATALRASLAELDDETRGRLTADVVARSGEADLDTTLLDEGWRNWLSKAIEHYKANRPEPAAEVSS